VTSCEGSRDRDALASLTVVHQRAIAWHVPIGGAAMNWAGVQTTAIAETTTSAITRLGLSAPSGLVPRKSSRGRR
jgi:hypothetical protein